MDSKFVVPKLDYDHFNVVSDIHLETKYSWRYDNNLTLIVGDFCNGAAADYIAVF